MCCASGGTRKEKFEIVMKAVKSPLGFDSSIEGTAFKLLPQGFAALFDQDINNSNYSLS